MLYDKYYHLRCAVISTAICVIDNTLNGTFLFTRHRAKYNYIFDGDPSGSFVLDEHSFKLEYNALIFLRQDMSNKNYTLQIETTNGGTPWTGFDNAIYT